MTASVLPVFVSSTWLDLQPEREAVREAVLRMKETQFVGMEYFGSRDETTRRASLDEIDRSELYVGICAARYGSGITEAEYRRARSRGLPCLIYFKDDATIPAEWRETDPAQTAKLDALKQELRTNHIIGPDFKSPDDLAAKLTADLHRWLFDNYLTTKLQGALRGEVSHDEAQALLDAVKDLRSLRQDLLDSLRGAGFNVASGERAVAVSGDDNLAVTGDDNLVVEHAAGDVVRGNKIVQEAPRPIIPTLHQLRAPVGDFVGREKEIADLLKTLRGGGSAAITGISGMGGIGKTELSFYVAERLRDTYPDAQLVLDMRGTDERPRDPSDALASCIRAFIGLEQRLPDDTGELMRLYRSVLEGKRALILLDNAHDSAQVRPLLPPAGSALLVTSRETIPIPGMKRVTLEQLRPAEARELLTGIARRVPADIADRICYLCGYLPLAVRAAASLLDITPDLDPGDYAAQLGDERTRLERIGVDPTIGIDVEASIGLSYQRLPPDAARVFRRLAVFPAPFDAAAEEAVCEEENHKHLSELLRRSLVLYNADTRRYRLHDLARLFADSRLNDEERAAGRTHHAEHYLNVLAKCNVLYERGGEAIKDGLARFDAERRNIEAGQKWACDELCEDEAAARLCNSYPNVAGDVLHLRQRPRERIVWREAALAAAQRLKIRASEGRHLGNLGTAYYELGELPRAIECLEQCVAILREVKDQRLEGVALVNLANAYVESGDTRRAIKAYEKCLAIAREIGDRRTEGYAVGNLAVAYERLGEIEQCIEYLENLHNIALEIGDERMEAMAWGNLGVVYERLGKTRRAIEFYEQRLIIAREIGDRHSEGRTHARLAIALEKDGNRDQAIIHAEAGLKILEEFEDPNADQMREQLARWRGEA
jgi:tetratricopeptide (TPR) repeat protein